MKAIIPLAALVLGLSACADNSPGGKAAHERHENFEAMGEAFKTINDELKGGSPDMAAVKAATDKLAGLAPQMIDWFPAGSGPQDGKKTHAREEVWTKPDEFRAAAEKYQQALPELTAAVAAEDAAALGAAAKSVGATCKGCHDKFKED